MQPIWNPKAEHIYLLLDCPRVSKIFKTQYRTPINSTRKKDLDSQPEFPTFFFFSGSSLMSPFLIVTGQQSTFLLKLFLIIASQKSSWSITLYTKVPFMLIPLLAVDYSPRSWSFMRTFGGSVYTLAGGHRRRRNVVDNGLRTFPPTPLPLGRALSIPPLSSTSSHPPSTSSSLFDGQMLPKDCALYQHKFRASDKFGQSLC